MSCGWGAVFAQTFPRYVFSATQKLANFSLKCKQNSQCLQQAQWHAIYCTIKEGRNEETVTPELLPRATKIWKRLVDGVRQREEIGKQGINLKYIAVTTHMNSMVAVCPPSV